MITPPQHPQEQARIESLYAHKILDTGADDAFDDLAQLAAQLCGVPIALVSLIDEDRQWFKARVGLDFSETNRDVSFCAHTINEEKTLVVEDASTDQRFHDNPLVACENGIRFYAGAKICDERGLPMGTLCIIDHEPHRFDESQQRHLEQLANQAGRQLMLHRLLHELAQASQRDELTGLLNRRGIIAHMKQTALLRDQIQAFVYIDIKRFKAINDNFGHSAGDVVLQQIAMRIEQAIDQAIRPAHGTHARLARFTGNEFVICLATKHEQRWIQDVFCKSLLDAISTPFTYNNTSIYLNAHMGIAASRLGERLRPSQAISDADIAMQQAKHNDSPVRFYDRVMRDILERESEIESRLRHAVGNDGISAAFEPILDLNTGKVFGFEVLARWTDPELGRVRPDHFIPVAERSGLIDQIFKAVTNQALTVCRQVTAAVQHDLFFSVNLSKAQLTDDRIFEQITHLTRRHRVDPSRLHLEVTESLVASSDQMLDKLHHLRKLGHPLMLDDFGTGTSSLSCLKSYPVQWIKIDRELTDAADKSRQYAAIIQAVSDLASNLDMKLVAEGIEDAHTIPLLQGMDVAAAQGWFWSKPLAAHEVADWLRAHNEKGIAA